MTIGGIDERSLSRGAVIAMHIERLSRGRIGETIGTESELMHQFEASRATVREAIRMLEARGIARMLRGRSGGLKVLPCGADRAVYLLSLHLEMLGLPLLDVVALRTTLGDITVASATEKIAREPLDEVRVIARQLAASAQDLRQYGLLRRQLWALLAEATRNPVLKSLIAAVDRVTLDVMPVHRIRYDRVQKQVNAIIAEENWLLRAIVANDPGEAVIRHRKSRELETQILALNIQGGRVPEFCFPSGGALNTRVLRAAVTEIGGRIIKQGLDVGDELGKIEEVRAECGLSPAVMREALRLMEDHGIIRVHTGRFGGIRVGPLRSPEMLDRIREGLMLHLDPSGADTCRSAVFADAAVLAATRKPPFDRTADSISDALGDACGNRVYAILAKVLDHEVPPDPAILARLGDAIRGGGCRACPTIRN